MLSETAVAAYVAVRCPGSRLPAELVQLIHQRTNGNPLFMVNIVEDLLTRGLLGERNGQWELMARIDEVEVGVPENLLQMIVQQIESVPELGIAGELVHHLLIGLVGVAAITAPGARRARSVEEATA